jgi:hypothetical protein
MFVLKSKRTGNLYTGNGWSAKKEEAKGFDTEAIAEKLIADHRMDAEVAKIAGDTKDFPGIPTGGHE